MKYIIGLFLSLFVVQVQAQTVADALRYSNLEVGGTARSVGIGGAIGALGADYSVLSTNPAGLATYRTNEFVLTPSVFNSNTTSLLENGIGNTDNVETSTKFALNNVGMILNNRPRRGKWSTFNIGIGYNRLATFNNEFIFKGQSNGSIVQRFTELANDGLFDEFEVGLAEDAIAIYTDAQGIYTNDFEDAATSPDYVLDREQLVRTKGSYSEMVFSVAGNYDEKLMVGITAGIPFINYEQEKVYDEAELEGVDDVAFFNNLNFQDDLTTSGVGINLKLGVIYRASQMLRLGAAVHSPTYMSLTDNFSTQLSYDYTDGNGNSAIVEESPDGTFEYKLRTPWRAMINASTIFGRKGFLSADVEYVDYSASDFNLTANSSSIEDQDYEIELNDNISNQYQSAINIRVGGEYAYNNFRFRAGYTISGTPYADKDITNNAYSLGVGMRERTYYIDFAYKNSTRDQEYTPYLLADSSQEQVVSNKISNSQFLLTLGFKF